MLEIKEDVDDRLLEDGVSPWTSAFLLFGVVLFSYSYQRLLITEPFNRNCINRTSAMLSTFYEQGQWTFEHKYYSALH